MKDLTIISKGNSVVSEEDVAYLERKFDLIFPPDLISVIKKYAGCSINEKVYYSREGNTFYPINSYLYFKSNTGSGASVENIYEGHLKNQNKAEFIPFAIDPGGWDYNVSINHKTYGQVWIDAWDSNEDNPYSYVASSLEDFINGLITEEEALKLGY